MNRFEWVNATSVDQALAAGTEGSSFKAGGVDLLDLMKDGIASPTRLVNIRQVSGLDKISEDDKSKIKDAVAAARKAMEGDNPDAIDEAVRTLTAASHKLAEEMYKKTAGSPGTGDAGTGPNGQATGESAKSDEKVVDAEFEEVDKDKK